MEEDYISFWRMLGRNIRRPINTAAVIILAAYTFAWGVWLASPFWEVFESAKLYSFLATIGPEWMIGLAAIIVAGVMAWGVFKHSFNALTRGAFVGCIFWLLIALAYFTGDWTNTGGITSLTISIYCAFVYLNIKVNRDNLLLDKTDDNI